MSQLNRYQQYAKIYQIIDLTGECKPYIGSTTQKTLAMRLSQHVYAYKMWKKGEGRKCMSYDIIEKGDYKIELIESYPCNNRDQLNAREGHYQKTRECCNKNISGRTKKQYYNDNVDKIKKKYKCPCGGRYIHKNKPRHMRTKKHKKFEMEQQNRAQKADG
jgi:hypothetical protein